MFDMIGVQIEAIGVIMTDVSSVHLDAYIV